MQLEPRQKESLGKKKKLSGFPGLKEGWRGGAYACLSALVVAAADYRQVGG